MNTDNLPKANQTDISTVAFQFFLDKRIFTKFDVTKQLRINGFIANHPDVRHAIDSMDVPDNYETELIRIKGRPVFVYYPEHADPTDYDPNAIADIVGNSRSGSTAQPTQTSQSYSSPKYSPKKTSKKGLFGSRGRYVLSAAYVHLAGFNTGSVVAIKTDNNQISIEEGPSIFGAKNLTVDRYYNLQLSKRDFENAFDSVPTELNITSSQGKIVITEK